MQREAGVRAGKPVGSGLSTTFTPMRLIERLLRWAWDPILDWHWTRQSRQLRRRQAAEAAAQLSDFQLRWWLSGAPLTAGLTPWFREAVIAEMRERGLR